MKLLRQVTGGVSRWLDGVAETIVAVIARLAPPRAVELIEGEGGMFTFRAAGRDISQDIFDVSSAFSLVQLPTGDGSGTGAPPSDTAPSLKGSRTEIVLRPSRFVFRQVELPRRASEFLDGVIRAQIDRLTPWSPNDAAFGWTRPVDIANDRIAVTVAATAKTAVAPFVQAATRLGADAVVVTTVPEAVEQGGAAIKVLEQRPRGPLEIGRVRRVLAAVLLVASLAAVISIGAAVVVADDLGERQRNLTRRIAQRGAALRAGLDTAGNTALAKLERRKHEDPSAVIALEALSQLLPDHTYVTELRIEGRKLQIIGITHDAPALIGLIEQSSHFTRATFFAPTTRSPSDPGERFHIEARIEPVFTPRT
jgi:general secretion pathway protein L